LIGGKTQVFQVLEKIFLIKNPYGLQARVTGMKSAMQGFESTIRLIPLSHTSIVL
jgi:hypothetical protein